MSVTNLYSNLPGHLVEFKDGGLQLTSSTTDTSSTKSLLILGTAFDGPINEPVKIDSITVSQVFGKEVDENGYPNGATLTKYAKQAFKNGFDDVRCMRVTGSQAYTTLIGREVLSYEPVYPVIRGSESTDGTGVIVGNTELTYDFLNPGDGNDPIMISNSASNSRIKVRKASGEEETEFGFGETGGRIIFTPYQSIRITAGLYPAVDGLTVITQGYSFKGEDAIVSGHPEYGKTKSLVLTNTTVTTETDPDTGTEVITGITAGGEGFSIKIDGVLYSLFKDTGAYLSNPIFPDITSYSEDGFMLLDSAGTLIDDSKYTITIDEETGNVSVVFTNFDGLTIATDDSLTLVYIPYELADVTRTLTDAFNGNVENSSINIAEMDGKLHAELLRVEVGDTVNPKVFLPADAGTKYTVNDSTHILTVTDSTGLNVNDEIRVYYKYDKEVTSDLELKIKSQWGGSIYKTSSVQVTESGDYKIITFKKPIAKSRTSNPETFSYSTEFYKTVDDLIFAMQNDINNLNMFDIEIVRGEGDYSLDLLQVTDGEQAFENGGDDGVKPTNNEMFIALSGERYTSADVGSPVSPYSTELVTSDMIGFLKTQGAYQILENYNVDYIYPAGVYADSVQTVQGNIVNGVFVPTTDFQRELALVCAVLTYRTKMTHGFIDVKPNSNTTMVGIDAYVAKLVNNHNNIYYMTDSNGDVIYDSDNKPMDIGWYTSVVVGPEVVMTSDVLGTYYGSPAIAYAALNAVIAPQSSPLNKALRNVNGIKFKFSNKQMDAIAGNRMVCFKLKNEGLATASSTPYVVNGVTAGALNCDYSDLAIVKVVTDVVDNIRQVADPFIGEQNTVEQRNALSALISKRLSKLVELGEIKSYEFEVSATIQQQLLGEASIALTIIPAMTLKRITTVVALRAAQ